MPIDKWINTLWYIHTIDCYSAMKWYDVPMNSEIQMHLQVALRREVS